MHRARQWRERYPLHYSFNKLKNRAKERGHAFHLTLAEYEQFALESGYAERKGKTAESFTIDRIEENRGYSVDNIRCLTLSENSSHKPKSYPGDPF
jgi:hypothetical protein